LLFLLWLLFLFSVSCSSSVIVSESWIGVTELSVVGDGVCVGVLIKVELLVGSGVLCAFPMLSVFVSPPSPS